VIAKVREVGVVFGARESSEKVCFKLKRPSNNAGLRPLFLKNRGFFGALPDTKCNKCNGCHMEWE